MVGTNSLVRAFGLRFHGNGIKQLAKDFVKACPAFHSIPPILPCLLHYALSAPRGKQLTVFLTSGEEKSSYSIFFLVLYSARITPFAVHYEKIPIHLCETEKRQREDTFIGAKKRTFGPKSDSITIFAF